MGLVYRAPYAGISRFRFKGFFSIPVFGMPLAEAGVPR